MNSILAKERTMKSHQFLNHAIIVVCVAVLFGCAAGMVDTSQRIPSALSIMEFNDVASKYMSRPTFVSIQKMKDGSKVLNVTMTAYGTNPHMVMFYERNSDQYINAIDKFFAWETTAMAKGDMLEKEIAVVPSPNGLNICFIFSSANQALHYLAIGHTAQGIAGKLTGVSMTLDHENAQILRKLLVDLPATNTHLQSDDYK